jgi:hypothetical protein
MGCRRLNLPRGPVVALAGGLLLAALSACVSALQTAASLPEPYLGRWYYVGSSGGITGRGMGDEGSGYIVIHADNTIDRHEEDGTLAGTTAFTLGRGPTIFSSEDQWIQNPGTPVPEGIAVSGDGQTMAISENVYDGFGRTYARSR